MIVNVICAAIETFIQMFVCFGVFIKAYDRKRNLSKFAKIVLFIILIIVYLCKVKANNISLISTSTILTDFPITIILIWIITGSKITKIVSWCFFSTATTILLKLPTLVIIGLVYDKSLSEMTLINNSQTWSRVINCAIFILVLIIGVKYQYFVIKYLKAMAYQRIVLLFIGAIEYLIIYYIMYIGWYGFTIQTLILTLSLIFMLFVSIVCLVVLIEYQLVTRINHLLKSKESNLRENYLLINQEINRNRRINHDKKHDFEYLYHCFEQKDYQKGLDYINQKDNYYNTLQRNLTWTGNGSIDFLINRAKARADEKKILFIIKVDIVEIPIEEYDFFSMLSNLLDNAIEAAMQNSDGNGRIALQILSLGNVFRLRLENTYVTEPVKKGKRFISSKDNNVLHGWGIENVREIVEKYDGKLDIDYGNGIFLVDLIVI